MSNGIFFIMIYDQQYNKKSSRVWNQTGRESNQIGIMEIFGNIDPQILISMSWLSYNSSERDSNEQFIVNFRDYK